MRLEHLFSMSEGISLQYFLTLPMEDAPGGQGMVEMEVNDVNLLPTTTGPEAWISWTGLSYGFYILQNLIRHVY